MAAMRNSDCRGIAVVYLHGFASSPGSRKAQAFAQALRECGVEPQIPDLNEGDFRGLTLSRQLALLDRLTARRGLRSVLLIGSSLGGYTAALFAAKSNTVAATVLMAPAFDFGRRWAARLGPEAMQRWEAEGFTPTLHYASGQDELVGFGLMEDAARHPAYPNVDVPTLVVHGRQDETVHPEVSERFAQGRPNVQLELIDAEHSLAGVVNWVVQRSLAFLRPWLACPPSEV